jgi:hypothetical protein
MGSVTGLGQVGSRLQRSSSAGASRGGEALLAGGVLQLAKRQSARNDAVLVDRRSVDAPDGLTRGGAVLLAFLASGVREGRDGGRLRTQDQHRPLALDELRAVFLARSSAASALNYRAC